MTSARMSAMTTRRRAPYAEWVEMYRRGISAEKIAEVVRAPVTTVRYHLRLAADANPLLRQEHHDAVKPVRRVGPAGLANLAAVVALFESEDRLPSSKAQNKEERALAAWLHQRRKDYDAGTLAPAYSEGLRAVPGWEKRTRKAKNEAQWEQRRTELVTYLAAGNDWPRHKSTDTAKEKHLGLWLQYQRTKLAAGQLDPGKQNALIRP
ncbi:MAG: helicase-associated [Pseudarthrobacter sp.]|nr:helicase-associated [Pseudarthrobacter sp.]